MTGQRLRPLPGFWLPDQSAGSGKAAMAFREIGVHEIEEVLWLRGESLPPVERLSGLDRKTVRRYFAAAQSCGAVADGSEASSAMSCCRGWLRRCARTDAALASPPDWRSTGPVTW